MGRGVLERARTEVRERLGRKRSMTGCRRGKDDYGCGKAMMIESSERTRYSSLSR